MLVKENNQGQGGVKCLSRCLKHAVSHNPLFFNCIFYFILIKHVIIVHINLVKIEEL